jgi:glucuronate isomerase
MNQSIPKGINMQSFINEDFLLYSESARRLYHDYAAGMPIIDYHNHLPPDQMAANHRFDNITQVWLYGDHYKWRAMRTHGVPEEYCTGAASDYDKFLQWSATVPYTVRNPLYHWTHLELKRYFGIDTLLNADTAAAVYHTCSEQLRATSHFTMGLLQQMNVKLLCTTDDPVDSLEYHQQMAAAGTSPRVLPAFRPDKAMAVDNLAAFNTYVDKLEQVCNSSIGNYDSFLQALKKRHNYFANNGCRVSDHGLEQMYAEDFTHSEIAGIFNKARSGQALTSHEMLQFKSAMLLELAEWDYEKGWVQQFHLGALRNNNSRRLRDLGPDTGWDSIGDFSQAVVLSKFLGKLDDQNKLAKTIIYNLNPADNELMATMIGNFNDGSVPGKIQWGSAWWFLDQKDGMIKQINALSNMGLISRFVGMLTDSRSFLSFPRHEYFRRILCQLFGEEMDRGELPKDFDLIGGIVQDICYSNAAHYFGWENDLA